MTLSPRTALAFAFVASAPAAAAPPGVPNLTTDQVALDHQGAQAELTYVVKNTGTAPTNKTWFVAYPAVDLASDNCAALKMKAQTVPALQPGETHEATVWVDWNHGDVILTYVDATDREAESDEDDNATVGVLLDDGEDTVAAYEIDFAPPKCVRHHLANAGGMVLPEEGTYLFVKFHGE